MIDPMAVVTETTDTALRPSPRRRQRRGANRAKPRGGRKLAPSEFPDKRATVAEVWHFFATGELPARFNA